VPATQASAQTAPPPADKAGYDEVEIVALVNGEPILASEVMPVVDDILRANLSKIPPSQLEAQRKALIQKVLKPLIETKTIVSDAKSNIPPEAMKNLEENFNELFNDEELPKLYEKTKTDNKPALDAELRKFGTSLEKERRAFQERTLAREWIKHKVGKVHREEITYDQMIAYYREHIADYEFPARARWQQIFIRAGNTRPKGEAYARVAELGNRVLDGESFEEVARQHSEGPTAASGGTYNWTTKGSLASTVLDQAIFTQPLGELSKTILEDEQGFHIVRVLEREDAGRKSFQETQAEIKSKIRSQRFQAAVKDFLAKVKTQAKVWTLYDGDISLDQQPVAEKPQNPRR
jgi:parvulin-like peptidyl-prolyl isomerase